jgi:protein PhnA
MTNTTPCPKCHSDITYPDQNKIVCTQCFHEWIPEEEKSEMPVSGDAKILDSNGNELKDGDTVIVIKDLPVKGSTKAVKAGTKVKNIKLTEGDHNLSCKVDGFGAMGLKSEFVRKA